MWEEQKSCSRAAEASILYIQSIVYIYNWTKNSKILYNKKKNLESNRQIAHFLSTQIIWKFEKFEILQMSRVHDWYKLGVLLDKDLCDVFNASVL